jgi:hypothetical protein
MMNRVCLLALVGVVCVQGQLKIFAVGADGVERETSVSYQMGTIGPGDSIQTRFKVRNTGVSAVTLQEPKISGAGFSVSGPSSGYVIAAGFAADVRVTFQATGTGNTGANLTVNSLSLLVWVAVVPAPVLSSQSGVDLPSGTAISAGAVKKGEKTALPLSLENRSEAPLTVARIAVSGSPAFAYRGPAALTLAPRAAQRIEIEFSPPANGPYTGLLTIDGRTFPLTGEGFDPPLPKPTIRIEGTPSSGQDLKVAIELAGVPESGATGTLEMGFQPLSGLPDDPAIRFVSGGGRRLSVQVKPGDARVWFGSLPDAVFQAGTTAGTIQWTLELGTHRETQAMALPPSAPAISTALALRETQDLVISLTGADNTRSMSQALFTFYDVTGRPISPGTIRTDIRREFEEFFRGLGVASGGTFTMRAAFAVYGGAAAEVSSVEAEIVNSAGGSRTQRIVFPATPVR